MAFRRIETDEGLPHRDRFALELDRGRRRRPPLTAKEVGRKTGIHPTAISAMVRGRLNPTNHERRLLAHVLGKTVQELFGKEVR